MQLNIASFKKTIVLFLPFILRPSARRRVYIALCIILLDITAASLTPYFAKRVVDGLSEPMTIATFITSFVILLGLFWIIEKISSHVQEIIFFPVVNDAIRDLTSQVVHHIHSLPMKTYLNLSPPEILSSIKRISMSARSFIKIFCLMLIPSGIKLIVALVVCIKMGSFGWGLLPGILFSLWMLYKGIIHYVEMRDQTWEVTDNVTMRINDSILNTKLSRFFLDLEMQSVNGLLKQEAILWNKTNIRLHSIHLAVGLVLGGTITFILYQAAQAVQLHTLTVGDFVMLKGQLLAAFLPFKNLSLELRQLAEAVIDIGKIRRILAIPKIEHSIKRIQNLNQNSKQNPKPNSSKGLISQEEIILQNVQFNYDNQIEIFKNFSLSILPGEKWVITGNNGSGKSSLLGLMAGLFSPTMGEIYIRGRKKEAYSESEYCKLLHYIPQEIRLFNQSLRENLLYGCDKNSINLTELNDILRLCGLDALIKNMGQGLETKVGDLGVKLSGGEKHRLALLRAFILKPDILLLDETLDALNLEQEQELVHTLFQNFPTIVIVSHHPQVLKLKGVKTFSMNEKTFEKSFPASFETPFETQPYNSKNNLTVENMNE